MRISIAYISPPFHVASCQRCSGLCRALLEFPWTSYVHHKLMECFLARWSGLSARTTVDMVEEASSSLVVVLEEASLMEAAYPLALALLRTLCLRRRCNGTLAFVVVPCMVAEELELELRM